MDYTEKMQSYMEALEEERRKILVFQRELPLCLELVTQAIETCKQQLSGTTCEYNVHGGQSECNSEQTSTEGPVLEEFIPIKRSRSEAMEQEHEDENNNELCSDKHPKDSSCSSSKKNKSEKSDWLRSAQLWNQTPDPPSKNVSTPKRVSVVEVKRNGGAFQPFHRDKNNPSTNTNTDAKTCVEKSNQSSDKDTKPQSSVHTAATSSTAETVTSGGGSGGGGGGGGGEGGSNRIDEKGGQNQRKQRRCWSPELHRRFLHALQQLGGSHAATPKQIRELMKVDGLTNDEVKSHLQKYRLHTRRPSPTIHQTANPPPPQFVVVGGIWMPPPEYATVTGATASAEAANATAANGIYAPVAAPSAAVPQASSVTQQPKPKQSEPSQSEGRDSHSHTHGHSGGRVRCNSPSTSSSTHTSTASPVY